MASLDQFIRQVGGVASVSELAKWLQVPESRVRDFARASDVKRLGSTFAFDAAAIRRLAKTVESEDEEVDDDDDGDELDEEVDEEDTEDDEDEDETEEDCEDDEEEDDEDD